MTVKNVCKRISEKALVAVLSAFLLVCFMSGQGVNAEGSATVYTADFEEPGTWSGKAAERCFSNSPFLYFGTKTPTAENGIITSPNWWDYTAGYRIRTSVPMDLTDETYGYVISYRMRISDSASVSPVDLKSGIAKNSGSSTDVSMSAYVANFTKELDAETGTVSCFDVNGTTAQWTTDKWYNVVHSVNAASQNYKLYDGETNALIWEMTRTGSYSDSYVFMLAQQVVTRNGQSNPDLCPHPSISYDDVTLLIYDKTQAPTLSNADIENGDTDVLRNRSFTFEFEQPVNSAPELYKGETKVETAAKIVNNTVTISLAEGVILDKKTEYTIDFSNVKNEGDTQCSEEAISFITEGINLLEDISFTSANITNYGVTCVFAVKDPHDYPAFTGYIAAAVYADGVLKDMTISEYSENNATEITKTFAVDAAAGNTISLMLFDTSDGVVPVCSGDLTIASAE